MRRLAEIYLVGVVVVGLGFVFGLTLAGETPHQWMLDLALAAIVLALAAYLYLSRLANG